MVSSVMYLHADTAAEHIAQALKSNRSLQTLNIVGWKFLGHNGIHPILESLMFNSTLQTLYIGKIDSETLSSFKRARETTSICLLLKSMKATNSDLLPYILLSNLVSSITLFLFQLDSNSIYTFFFHLFDPTMVKQLIFNLSKKVSYPQFLLSRTRFDLATQLIRFSCLECSVIGNKRTMELCCDIIKTIRILTMCNSIHSTAEDGSWFH